MAACSEQAVFLHNMQQFWLITLHCAGTGQTLTMRRPMTMTGIYTKTRGHEQADHVEHENLRSRANIVDGLAEDLQTHMWPACVG